MSAEREIGTSSDTIASYGTTDVGDSTSGELTNHDGVISVLLPRVIIATVAVFLVLDLLKRGSNDKSWDKAMYVGSGALSILLGIWFLARPPKRIVSNSTIVVSTIAAAGMLVGISVVERPSYAQYFWEGFGHSVALLSAGLALVLWTFLERIQAVRSLRLVLDALVGLLVAVDLASLWRTLAFMPFATNNTFLLNDMLAPVAGRVPYDNFVPGYIGLYGFVLLPFRHVMSPVALAQLALVVLSALGLLAVVLGILIAYRSMVSPSFWVAAGLVVPITCVTVYHFAAPESSVGSHLQFLAYRLFPAMLVSLLGIEALDRQRRGLSRTWHLPALGALAGLILWNTFDFGFFVTVAYSIVLVIGLPQARRWNLLALWSLGVLGGLASYPLACLLAMHPVNLAYFGLFARAFENGFFAAPIQVLGPVLVVLPLLLASSAVGLCLLWRQRERTGAASTPSDRAAITLALIGTWGTLGFLYYLDRSFASELQVLLLPCGVCLVALLSLGMQEREHLRLQSHERGATMRVSLCLLPVALAISLGFGSLLQSPNPELVAQDLANPTPNLINSFDAQLLYIGYVTDAKIFAQGHHGTLGYFSDNGNFVQLWTGVPNLNLYDEPQQGAASATLRADECGYLRAHATTFLLVSLGDLPVIKQYLCGLYAPVRGEDSGLVFARTSTR